ncbi:MAG: OmpA family protein [Labilithrix sp.]|nr:OmpA family protein [Labilithrix sp.]
MSKKILFPLIAVFSLGVAAGSLGCRAEAKIGNAEPKAATPPPPEPAPPPTEEPKAEEPPPKPIKALGKAKIEGNEIKIPGKVHFETNKAAIKEDKETKEILQTLVDVLKENDQITKLRIDGHTDDTGTSEHNHKLSQARAEAIIEWLAKNGVDKSRLEGKGWGEEHPIAKNDTAANKEQNRRVEFKVWEIAGKPTDAQKGEATAGGPVVDDKKDAKPAATTPKK